MNNRLTFNKAITSSNGNLHINLLQRGYSIYNHQGTGVGEFDTDSTFHLYFFPSHTHTQPSVALASSLPEEEEDFR
ncbi:MAG: hypothetical protein KDD67_03485 [Ignavibacteriae bacterium]|nr:hypothetical protein [Ignavibacteriota bacterium]MCB9215097.1 hypothetical protein [Ignavibacteria bacterium]